jgi:hypothetical protein
MTVEPLRAIPQARPFRPFTIQMTDGRAVFVPHSEFLSHSASGRTIMVHHAAETFSVVDLLLVNEPEVHGLAVICPIIWDLPVSSPSLDEVWHACDRRGVQVRKEIGSAGVGFLGKLEGVGIVRRSEDGAEVWSSRFRDQRSIDVRTGARCLGETHPKWVRMDSQGIPLRRT